MVTVEKVERTRVVEVLVTAARSRATGGGGMIYVWLIVIAVARDRVLLRGRDGVHRRQPPRACGTSPRRATGTAARYLEAFKPARAAAVDRDDGRDDRPHHRRRRSATWALLPVLGGMAADRGHALAHAADARRSARSSRRRWRASGRPALILRLFRSSSWRARLARAAYVALANAIVSASAARSFGGRRPSTRASSSRARS